MEKSLNKLKNSSSDASKTGNFDYVAYVDYLQGLSGGMKSKTTAKSISADIEKFMNYCSRGSKTTDHELLFSRRAIESYFVYLKATKEYQPTTIVEKLRRISSAVRFIIHETDDTPEGNAVYHQGQKMIDNIKDWCHSMHKQIKLQRQRHSSRIRDELALSEEPDDTFMDPRFQAKLQQAIDSLTTVYQSDNAAFLTAYCAARLIYGNGQRSGVVENLTMDEFQKRTEGEDNKTIITCHEHKTGPQGAADLVMDKEDDELLEFYLKNVRRHIPSNDETKHLFFLTTNGKRYTQVYRKLKDAMSTTSRESPTLPTPSTYRVVVRTNAAQHQPDHILRNVAKHMCHSSETARQYYTYSNTSDAIAAHDVINDMAKRRRWTDEETDRLLKEWPLANRRPELKTCAFLKEKCTLERTPKNIQDKWRQLKEKLG